MIVLLKKAIFPTVGKIRHFYRKILILIEGSSRDSVACAFTRALSRAFNPHSPRDLVHELPVAPRAGGFLPKELRDVLDTFYLSMAPDHSGLFLYGRQGPLLPEGKWQHGWSLPLASLD